MLKSYLVDGSGIRKRITYHVLFMLNQMWDMIILEYF